MNAVIQNRLALLREEMEKAGMAYYMIPTADYHNSEYVDEYFKAREYFSGFTGSNGTLQVPAELCWYGRTGQGCGRTEGILSRRTENWKEPALRCSACRRRACRKSLIFYMNR